MLRDVFSKRATLRNKTKIPFPFFPLTLNGSNENCRPRSAKLSKSDVPFLCISIKPQWQNLKNAIFFKMNIKSKRRHIRIWFFSQNFALCLNLSPLEWRRKGGNGIQILPILAKNWPILMSKLSDFQFWDCHTSKFGLRAKLDVVVCDFSTKLKITSKKPFSAIWLFLQNTTIKW